MDYERIRFDGKTVILRDPKLVPFFDTQALTGVEVDRFGNEVAPRGVDERRHIIQEETITRRTPLKWNHKYAELESI